jgi:RNA polymerase sigma factor (sigma-70 family)
MTGTEVHSMPIPEVVRLVQAGEQAGMAALYAFLSRGAQPYLRRRLDLQDVPDALHDVFVEVVAAIQQKQLRDATRVMGFARTVARRKVALYLGMVIRTRRHHVDLASVAAWSSHPSPERTAISRQQQDLIAQNLVHLSGHERDVLTRFYIQEQSAVQIRAEMNLTETQFRLLKWRSKARLEQLSRKSVAAKPPVRQGPLARVSV